jgi:hypothetical protein
MKRTFNEQTQKNLIKKFHVLLAKVGFDGEDKENILSEYNVKHTTDLTCLQLIEICNRLSNILSPDLVEMDKYRKRVIAAISEWLRNKDMRTDLDYIKGVACKAAQAKTFNSIPLNKLRAIYATFTTYNKISKQTSDVIETELSGGKRIIDYSQLKTIGNA